jgi:hypothetical protein
MEVILDIEKIKLGRDDEKEKGEYGEEKEIIIV